MDALPQELAGELQAQLTERVNLVIVKARELFKEKLVVFPRHYVSGVKETRARPDGTRRGVITDVFASGPPTQLYLEVAVYREDGQGMFLDSKAWVPLSHATVYRIR